MDRGRSPVRLDDPMGDDLVSQISDEGVDEDVSTSSHGDGSRVKLFNLPTTLSYKQLRNFINKRLKGYGVRKIRYAGDSAYFSLASPAEAAKAIHIFDKLVYKNRSIKARLAPPEIPIKHDKFFQRAVELRSARHSVTPLADMPYEEQLERKMRGVSKVCSKLGDASFKAKLDYEDMRFWGSIKEIRPSPRVKNYRNKCEFTIGRDREGNIRVGFVGGKFLANQHVVLDIDMCDNIPIQMKIIVKEFEKFVINSGKPPLDENKRTGFWRMLTVRDFGFDVMLIITVFPSVNNEEKKCIQNSVKDLFMDRKNLLKETDGFLVTSIFWQELKNASDSAIYEHVAGTPYIYETIGDCRFRVSPGAFFQPNSSAAEILYAVIAESCEFETANCGTVIKEATPNDLVDNNNLEEEVDGPQTKTMKFDVSSGNFGKPIILLDICCGTGTIGISLLKRISECQNVFLLGIDCVSEAIEDANSNARDNGLSTNQYKFICGKAEDLFRYVERFLPASFDLNSSRVLGILDPPRAGMHNKVIQACRKVRYCSRILRKRIHLLHVVLDTKEHSAMFYDVTTKCVIIKLSINMLECMHRLIYVSCNPLAALKNMLDLCRPTSKKYHGDAFRASSITPVDMLPQTYHCEWVVQFDRYKKEILTDVNLIDADSVDADSIDADSS